MVYTEHEKDAPSLGAAAENVPAGARGPSRVISVLDIKMEIIRPLKCLKLRS
jgi:hypothetical protein